MLKMNVRKALLLFFIPAVFIACGKEQNQKKQPQTTADYVEQASFVTLQGDTVHVSDFKGKVVMIDFWETWCKPCIESFSTVNKIQKEYADRFVAIAVTPGFSDTKEDAKTFAKEHNYDFIYAMDTHGLHKKLNVRGIPFKVFIAANGEFIKTSMGSNGPEADYKKITNVIENHSDKPVK